MSEPGGPQRPFESVEPDPFGAAADPGGFDPDMPVVGASDFRSAPRGRPWMALGAAALVGTMLIANGQNPTPSISPFWVSVRLNSSAHSLII